MAHVPAPVDSQARPSVLVVTPDLSQPLPLAKRLSEHLGVPLSAPARDIVDTHSAHEIALSQLGRSERAR